MIKVDLRLGDCLEVMKDIPDKSIDLILCDLPYGATQNPKDKRIPFAPMWEQYKRIIKERGCIVLFAQGKFYIELCHSNLKMFRYDDVWDKVLTTGFLNAKKQPMRQHEQLAIFYKKSPTYNPQFTEGKPLHSKGTAYKSKEMTNRNYGKVGNADDSRAGSTQKYPTSILRFQKPHPSVAKYQTEKPVALLENIVRTYTNEGDTVLDNCMGSGNVGVACVRTNRNFIGIDKAQDAFELAIKTIQGEKERLCQNK